MTKEYYNLQGDLLALRQIRETELDRVFVRDLILPVSIGIWSEEKNSPQRVRFHVYLSFHAFEKPAKDETPVISYDFIIEGIRMIVARGHIPLVETLAGEIAKHCLSHSAAAEVRVRIEKIDRLPGVSLGCEIFRRKTAV